MTVRRAVDILVNEGLLERRPGKGLFTRSVEPETWQIQVLVGNLCWAPAVQIARGAREIALRKGAGLILSDAHGNVADDLNDIRRLPFGVAKGAILMSLHTCEFHRALAEVTSGGYPAVVVDQTLNELDVSSVCSDNVSGGREIAKVLLAAGHRRIAFLGDITVATTRDRLLGLREELDESGVCLACARDVRGKDQFSDWSPGVSAAVDELVKMSDPPTAIACSCDAVAGAVYRALAAHGLHVPQDVSVTGFDDDPMAEWLSPALSTVRQPFFDIGRRAMELLYAKVVNPAAPAVRKVLPVQFINRDSVAACKQRKI